MYNIIAYVHYLTDSFKNNQIWMLLGQTVIPYFFDLKPW